MKKILLIFTLLVSIFTAQQVISVPVYTDEIPQSYINYVKDKNKTNLKQTLPVYDTENALEVKVYSPERIQLSHSYNKNEDGTYSYRQNYDIGDKMKLLVAEDVVKNNQVVIKKGTPVTGIVQDAQIGTGGLSSPDEILVSLFKTKDISNKDVKLYGSISQSGMEIGPLSMILFNIPTFRAAIPKNKIYTLYYK